MGLVVALVHEYLLVDIGTLEVDVQTQSQADMGMFWRSAASTVRALW